METELLTVTEFKLFMFSLHGVGLVKLLRVERTYNMRIFNFFWIYLDLFEMLLIILVSIQSFSFILMSNLGLGLGFALR